MAVKQSTNKTRSPEVSINLADLIALRADCRGFALRPGPIHAARSGNYVSRVRGRGMEFAEVRSYQPGDDVRSIDWRVTARRGRPHTKLFHEERERPVLLAIDYRRPMFFATRGSFKAVQASKLAAMLAWRSLEQGDRVGAFLFSEERQCELRPQLGKAGVLNLLRQMVADPAWHRPQHKPFDPQQRLAETLMRLRRVARPGSLILIISDFAQWDAQVEKQLTLLRRHNDLSLIFCYDPLESELPPSGSYRISDGAHDLTMNTMDRHGRDRYRGNFIRHQDTLKQFCRQQSCLFLTCVTNESPLDSLRQGLLNRSGA